MATQNKVAIRLRGGLTIDVWDEYALTISMMYPGSAWTFHVHASQLAEASWNALRQQALLGENLYLYLDDTIQLSGLIEVRREDAGRDGVTMTLSGRDLSGPALDWDADPGIQLRNTTLEDALVKLFEPLHYSLYLTDGATQSKAQQLRHRNGPHATSKKSCHIDLFKIRPGDRIWQVADTLCKKAGYMIWSSPYSFTDQGQKQHVIGVVVDAPKENGDPEMLLYRMQNQRVEGGFTGNVLHSTYEAQIRTIPTEVTANGHTKLADGQDTKGQRVVFNTQLNSHPLVVSDLTPQPMYLNADRVRAAGDAQRAAEREIARAMANFVAYDATVQGHTQHVGGENRVWSVNTIVRVADVVHDLDAPMLTTSVHFEGSRARGQLTTIRCVPLGAIQVVPEDMPVSPRHDPRALRRDAATLARLASYDGVIKI